MISASVLSAVSGQGAMYKIGQGELVHGIHGIQSAGPEIFPKVFFLLLKNFLILKTAHTSSMIPKGQVPERKP